MNEKAEVHGSPTVSKEAPTKKSMKTKERFTKSLLGVAIFLALASLAASVFCFITVLQIKSRWEQSTEVPPGDNDNATIIDTKNIELQLNSIYNSTREILIGQNKAIQQKNITRSYTCKQMNIEKLQEDLDRIEQRQKNVCESLSDPEATAYRSANFSDGGGWTVFQRRMNGSVDFYRDWNDYVNGFGEQDGEFWMGLQALYQITTANENELRVDMIDYDGNHLYAEYSSFSVGSASTNYRLSVSGFSGNIRDSLSYHNNQAFSTKDVDRDPSLGDCAEYNKGGWWYKACQQVNLNGLYGVTNTNGMRWYDGVDKYAWFSELKFRQKL